MPRVTVSSASGLPVDSTSQIAPFSNFAATPAQDFFVGNYLQGVDGGIQYIFEVPDNYSSTPAWSIKWTSQTGSATDVRWEIRYRFQAVGELLDTDDTPDDVIITQDTASEPANPDEQTEETFTMTGTVAAEDLCYIEVWRMGAHANDDKLDDVQTVHLAFDYAT